MLAVESRDAPSVIALTRQRVPHLRTTSDNLSQYGAYILQEASKHRQVTLLATGSEVEIAVKAKQLLEQQGIATAVISMPCWRLFDQQPHEYQSEVLGKDTIRVAVEAASPFGWDKYIGENGTMIGMTTFGASAPATDLYKHFDITAEKVVRTVLDKL